MARNACCYSLACTQSLYLEVEDILPRCAGGVEKLLVFAGRVAVNHTDNQVSITPRGRAHRQRQSLQAMGGANNENA